MLIECDVDIDIDVDTDLDVDCDVDADSDTDQAPGIDVGEISVAFYGGAEGRRLGEDFAGGGDINGDGRDDIVLGAYASGAYVFFGPITPGLELADRDVHISTGLDALSFAGDLNGDGFDDLLVGDTWYGEEPYSGTDMGAVYLYYGPVTGLLEVSDADAILVGSVSDHAGENLDGGSDLDGDGLPDFLVAGTGFPDLAQHGVVYLQYSAPSGAMCLVDSDARLMGGSEDDLAGYSAAMAGDVDGDGIGDVIVGAVLDDVGAVDGGSACLFLGPIYGDRYLADADAVLAGETSLVDSTGDQAGSSVSSAGDHDGDGYDDVLIGASFDSEGQFHSGTTYLIHGPVAGLHVLCQSFPDRLVGERHQDISGIAVVTPGDMDGDGRPDIAVGAHAEASGGAAAGAAYIFLQRVEGAMSLAHADLKIVGEGELEYLGAVLTSAGDADGDGRDDLLVDGDGMESGVSRSGAAYFVPGSIF